MGEWLGETTGLTEGGFITGFCVGNSALAKFNVDATIKLFSLIFCFRLFMVMLGKVLVCFDMLCHSILDFMIHFFYVVYGHCLLVCFPMVLEVVGLVIKHFLHYHYHC